MHRAGIQGMVTVGLLAIGSFALRSRVYAVLSVTVIPAEFKRRISWRPPRRAMSPIVLPRRPSRRVQILERAANLQAGGEPGRHRVACQPARKHDPLRRSG